MPKELDVRNAVITALVAGVAAGAISFGLSLIIPFGPNAPSLGVFPLFSNLVEFVAIVVGVLIGVEVTEARLGKDLYSDSEVFLGAVIIGLLGPLTIGFSVFGIQSVPLAVAVGTAVQAILFSVFALAFARAYKVVR